MAARARRKPEPSPAPTAPRPPAFGTFRLDQLRSGQCRFVCVSVGSDHRFCGRPTTIGGANKHGTWCDAHLAVVFEDRRRAGRG